MVETPFFPQGKIWKTFLKKGYENSPEGITPEGMAQKKIGPKLCLPGLWLIKKIYGLP